MTMYWSDKLILGAAVFFMTAISAIPSYSQYRTDGGYAGLYDSETVTALKKHLGYLSSASLEGRKAGSDGEKAAAAYMYSCLKDYGIDMLCPQDGDVFGISDGGADTLTSRNIVGFVQGYDPDLRDRYIVVGARLDNLGTNTMTVDGKPVEQIYYGANGNASGLAMMAELAGKVATNSILFRRSVIFVAFGASSETHAGAWYFLNRSFSDSGNIDAMINLDMLGTGDRGFYAYTASNPDLNAVVSSVSKELQPLLPELVTYEIYPSDNMAFYAKEIPSVMFTTGRYPEHNTPKDTWGIIDFEMMERELEYIYNFTEALANTGLELAFDASSLPAPKPSEDDVYAYYDCDQRPMFLNSTDPRQFLEKWVYQYLKYPKEAVQNGIQGRVVVDFIIDKSGNVTDVHVTRSADPLLDEEAVRVIGASPKWRPGRMNGERVRTSMSIPVEFRLEKNGSFGINGRVLRK